MAICLIKKGGGGIQSEDVTALRSEVLKGKTALTIDSNDEVIEGTMELLTANSDLVHVMMCFDRGAGDHWGMGGAIDSPSHGRGIIISMRPEDFRKYALDDRSVFVFMPVPDLRPENIRSDKNIAKIQGSIPIWSVVGSGWGDILYAWADEGHAWDHPVAGRGVLSKIPNGHIIEGANWVFLKAPTLLPWNIRKGVNVLGVEGTLPDYSAGRVAFNGATFDGILLSGVADKGKEIQLQPEDYHKFLPYTNYTSNSAPHRKFNGIKDGGLHFSVISTDSQYWRSEDYLRTAVFFADSVNMTPFRKLKIGVKFFDGVFKVENYVSDSANFEVGIDIVSVNDLQLRNEGVYKYLFKYVGGVKTTPRKGKVSISNQGDYNHANNDKVLQGIYNWHQMYKELDVSDINEQCFLIAYCLSITNYSSSYAVASGILNHIEFIN